MSKELLPIVSVSGNTIDDYKKIRQVKQAGWCEYLSAKDAGKHPTLIDGVPAKYVTGPGFYYTRALEKTPPYPSIWGLIDLDAIPVDAITWIKDTFDLHDTEDEDTCLWRQYRAAYYLYAMSEANKNITHAADLRIYFSDRIREIPNRHMTYSEFCKERFESEGCVLIYKELRKAYIVPNIPVILEEYKKDNVDAHLYVDDDTLWLIYSNVVRTAWRD